MQSIVNVSYSLNLSTLILISLLNLLVSTVLLSSPAVHDPSPNNEGVARLWQAIHKESRGAKIWRVLLEL